MKEFQKKQVMVQRSATIQNLLRTAEQAVRQEAKGSVAMSRRDRLVVENTKFVVTVAGQYLGMGMAEEDLVQEGLIGLMEAAENYDESKGVKFISYAVWHIRCYMQRALTRNGRGVKVPVGGDWSEVQMRRLEDPLGADSDLKLIDTIADEQIDPTDTELLERERKEMMTQLLGLLEPRERDVIVMHYGLVGQTLSTGERYEGDDCTLDTIAAEMGVVPETVRLVREEALRKMSQMSQISR